MKIDEMTERHSQRASNHNRRRRRRDPAELKDILKEHQITTKIQLQYAADKLKDILKEHQITTERPPQVREVH